MNFLVTGAAGFLGSALANRLAHEGHQVRGIDDLSAGDPDRLQSDVLFTRGDVIDRPKLWTLLQNVDSVYHLAARVEGPQLHENNHRHEKHVWYRPGELLCRRLEQIEAAQSLDRQIRGGYLPV